MELEASHPDVIVPPRVLSPWTGERILLVDAVREFAGKAPVVWIQGRPGTGKTTALRVLHGVLGEERDALDEPAAPEVLLRHGRRLVVAACGAPPDELQATVFRLAPWTQDEWVEYLLATHREQCGSVIQRLAVAPDVPSLQGNAELCRRVLDCMAMARHLQTVADALRALVHEHVGSDRLRRFFAHGCLRLLDRPGESRQQRLLRLAQRWAGEDAGRLLRHRSTWHVLAAGFVAAALRAMDLRQVRLRKVDPELLVRILAELADEPAVLDGLGQALHQQRAGCLPLAVSLLALARPGWRPDPMPRSLAAASLPGVRWDGVDLKDADLDATDFTGADLTCASLEAARARHACFLRARLTSAELHRIVAEGAVFADADLSFVRGTGANLRLADLTGARCRSAQLPVARLQEAVLVDADLQEAQLDGADLKGANLTGASFTGAKLLRANLSFTDLRQTHLSGADLSHARLQWARLDGLHLSRIRLLGADLSGAGLTGSRFREAKLRSATLHDTELAEVDWEGADLREASFTGATFHLGSSRGGLVFSTTPSEGSRTGFYTEDLRDQQFRPPEEIRRANLCGTDLRGAHVEGVDFYLVDLRGAKLDPKQVPWLRRCGAILGS